MTDNGKKSKDEASGYKGHKPGSRKSVIHQLYDTEGAEVAWTRGVKLRLKESSLRSWFSRWGESPVKAKVVSKTPAVKKPAKVATKVKPEATAKPDGGAAAAA
jgi:hypothetical protein